MKKYLIFLLLVLAVIAVVMWLSWPQKPISDSKTVPFDRTIENAVNVVKLKNEFVIIERVWLGGAGAGGMGAPAVYASSPAQFLLLVSPGAIIYTVVQPESPIAVKKTYWAGISGKSIIVIWEDTNSVPAGQWWVVSSFSDKDVTFVYEYEMLFFLYLFTCFLLGLIALLFGSMIVWAVSKIYEERRRCRGLSWLSWLSW